MLVEAQLSMVWPSCGAPSKNTTSGLSWEKKTQRGIGRDCCFISARFVLEVMIMMYTFNNTLIRLSTLSHQTLPLLQISISHMTLRPRGVKIQTHTSTHPIRGV